MGNRIKKIIVKHRVQIGIFIFAFAVLALRRIDALTNAQLWAEDGGQWLQPVINDPLNISSFTTPYAGYLSMFARIVAFTSGLFPLELVPLFFGICALLVQALPLVYLWSKRTNYLDNKLKVFITIAYLTIPFSAEIHANITNSQWFLALVLFLLIFIKESPRLSTRLTDYVIVAVASLSGPFSIVLSPVVAYEAYRDKRIRVKHAIIWIGAIIQVLYVLLSKSRGEQLVGYDIVQLLKIVGGQVFGAGLFGYESIGFFLSKPWIAPILALLGTQMLLYVFIKSNRQLRFFILFASAIFLAALISPNGNLPGLSWWQTLSTPQAGGRYYFLLHLAIFISLGWLIVYEKNILIRGAAGLLVALVVVVGIPKDFIHAPYTDLRYQQYVHRFERAPKGTTLEVPINPGPPWNLVLTK